VSFAVPVFLVIAILYSTVGFGGGSGYLAILSATGMDHEKMRFIALCCNILVVLLNTLIFIRKGVFDMKKVFPFILLSIPMAILGGWITLPTNFFFVLLGITLFAAGILMMVQLPYFGNLNVLKFKSQWSNTTKGGIMIGGVIGFISGLVGIGGGIFLAPFLHLNQWGKSITIAASASLFILVNSVAGISGQILNHGVPITLNEISLLLGAVVAGSLIGTTFTFRWINTDWIRGMTAVLVIFAAVRILVLQLAN
jgi:uncharacterized protein